MASYETPGLIFFNIHTELTVAWGLKSCSNGRGPLIKMATMPIYATKTLKNLLQNQESFIDEFWYIGLRTRSTTFIQMGIVG